MRSLALILTLTLAACGGGGSQPTATTAPLIEAYGDSTTQGWQVSNGQGHLTAFTEPADLQSDLGVQVVNEGVGGTEAVQLLTGTDSRHAPWSVQMANSTASIVLLNFGLNEPFYAAGTQSVPHQSPGDFRDTLTQLVRGARAFGKTVVLQEPNPTCEPVRATTLAAYVQAVRDVSQTESVPLVRAYDNMLSLDWQSLLTDCLHPTDAGYDLKASYTASVLRPLLTH